ncbi:hypothetical protein BH09BAC1_BH09BAC1_25580 [soil metagenome]
METRRRPIWKRLVFATLLCFVILLAVELLLGLIFLVKDRHELVEDVHDEPYLYYLYNEGPGTNVHGFKTAYTQEKPLGIYRIVLVGGSVARGREPENSIAHYLEQELSQRYNADNLQVVNAGISGYVLQQELILIQTIVQNYKPDLIIGLDGYNDLLTYYLNQSMNTNVALPPHQWRDFKAIKEHRFRKKPYSRFAYFFKNINRVKEYMVRSSDLHSDKWIQKHQEDPCGTFCGSYFQLMDDTEAFCRAKSIWYVQFVQPINFNATTPFDGAAKTITQVLYNKLDTFALPRPYAFSLAHALDNEDSLFYDDVHLIPEGNQRIASAMADSLAPVFYQIFR